MIIDGKIPLSQARQAFGYLPIKSGRSWIVDPIQTTELTSEPDLDYVNWKYILKDIRSALKKVEKGVMSNKEFKLVVASRVGQPDKLPTSLRNPEIDALIAHYKAGRISGQQLGIRVMELRGKPPKPKADTKSQFTILIQELRGVIYRNPSKTMTMGDLEKAVSGIITKE